MLNIEINTVDGVLHVALEGQLNNLTAKELAQRIDPELKDVRAIVIDMAKLDYITSAGLRILLMLQKHMDEVGGEDVRILNANQSILDTLEMTGFSGLINVE